MLNLFVGKPFNPHFIINNVVSNIICSMVFGHRFDYSDENFMKLIKWFDKSLRIQASIWAQVRHFKATDEILILCTIVVPHCEKVYHSC